MIEIIFSLLVLGGLMALNDWLWRKKILRGEFARKFVHITTGVFTATWPFFMEWRQIQVIWLLGVTFIVLGRKYKIFRSVHEIERLSWGDVVGPFTLGALTLFEPHKAVFSAVVLHVAIADGLAAIIGVRYGKGNQYKIMGATKSIAGSSAFFVSSVLINLVLYFLSGLDFGPHGLVTLLLLSVGATMVENIATRGFDNVLVPVYALIMLELTLSL
jgi:phytol kinase